MVLAPPEHAFLGGRGYPTHFGCGEQHPCKAYRRTEFGALIDPLSRRGEIYVHPRLLRNEVGGVSPGELMAHELGHVFYLHSTASLGVEPSPVYNGRRFDPRYPPNHTFAVNAVHGGPVPYARFANGTLDETHWADSACPTLMAQTLNGCAGV